MVFCIFFAGCTREKVIIITKGKGGDSAGSVIIQENLAKVGKGAEIFNLDSDKLTENACNDYEKCVFIGQGAAGELVQIYNRLKTKSNIALYSHIYSENLVNFLKSSEIHGMELFITNSELTKITGENPELQAKFLKRGVKITARNLPITTVKMENKIENSPSLLEIHHSDAIIWLGGSYMNQNNQKVVVTNEDLARAIKKLNPGKRGKKLAFIASPRFFSEQLTRKDRLERIKILQNIKGNITVHLPENIYQDFQNLPGIYNSAKYTDIVKTLNLQGKSAKNYASMDQYNLFADLLFCITPFTFKPDVNQEIYLKNYQKTCHFAIENNALTTAILAKITAH